MRRHTLAPAPTFALNPNPRYTHALSGCVVNERFPGAAMVRVQECRWLKGVLLAGVVAGCGDEDMGRVECADRVSVGPSQSEGYISPGDPRLSAALLPGDAARVVVSCNPTRACILVRQSECVAEWSDDGVLNVAATVVYEDVTQRSGALFWRTEACHGMAVSLTADCGDVIVPDEPAFRVRLNERTTFEAPIPFTPQRLEVRE